jgi:hypothetical protein
MTSLYTSMCVTMDSHDISQCRFNSRSHVASNELEKGLRMAKKQTDCQIMRQYYRTLRYATKAFPKPGKHTWPPTDQVTTVNCPCACYEGIWESGGKTPLILINRSVYKMSGSASRPDSLNHLYQLKGPQSRLDAFFTAGNQTMIRRMSSEKPIHWLRYYGYPAEAKRQAG